MSDNPCDKNNAGIRAAADAVARQLGSEASTQKAYFHRFTDGNVSLELEWIDPVRLAMAAIEVYLGALTHDHGT